MNPILAGVLSLIGAFALSTLLTWTHPETPVWAVVIFTMVLIQIQYWGMLSSANRSRVDY